jgi:hypothetical protein
MDDSPLLTSNANIVKGSVVKIQKWCGVVLETHFDEQNRLSIILVQTARNIFRGHGPEFIDVRLLPEAVQPATFADLQQEVAVHNRLLNGAVERMMNAATVKTDMPVAAD